MTRQGEPGYNKVRKGPGEGRLVGDKQLGRAGEARVGWGGGAARAAAHMCSPQPRLPEPIACHI